MSEYAHEDLVRELSEHVRGEVHAPCTNGWEEGRSGMQQGAPHRPGAVVVAAGAEDVRAAVAVASRRRVPITAQRTGHGQGAGIDGGILVHTRSMDRVRVDPERRAAWVGAGALWSDVIGAGAPHGLVPLAGSAPGVGAVSYTLGGGVGLLARRHGFAADHVRRVDLVTPDGTARTATAEHEPELFWAVRGAGASLGIVTGMEIGLFAHGDLYGGSLVLDTTEAPAALDAWLRWTGTVPEELTSGVSQLVYPDVEGVPEAWRGRRILQISAAWCGPLDEGPAWIEPLRRIAPVLSDTFAVRPWTDAGAVFDEHTDPAAFDGRSVLVDTVPEGAAEALAGLTGPSAPCMSVVSVRHLGGALARPPRMPSAVGHRGASYAFTVLTFPAGGGAGARKAARGLRERAAALFDGHGSGRSTTLAFGTHTPDEVGEAFAPDDRQRLIRLSRELDPYRLWHSHRPLR
ncbi:FAD-binding oxidoreductase [Nocardiopsis sp. HNM0947]|uniref:FAD-binding oxidoreductase n=1 Tax=Nocardiopsis coralli TaxID=2772213 RepID=A0ABR9P6Z9_9ACTN|nr:FAD-binding oxidoreductase [Nocardiopsis coralli]MBE2999622.1 FAD-binding oxidoreductase [Nocardiopsis coralli]